jgi:ribosome-interacting GTPase 1
VPANLTPQYKEAEQRFREAQGHEQKLEALHEMMALLPKHKGTEKLQADLRRRIAKLEEEGQHARHGGQRADPGHVPHEGAGQWALIGAPNAGKSALVRALTHAHPEVAAYPFTTRVPLPGMMPFEEVQVQLVDTPAIAAGRGESYMPNLVRNADGVLWVVDVLADDLAADVAALEALLERARVAPEARALPPDAPPFVQRRPVLVAANKCDLDDDRAFLALARESLPADVVVFAVSALRGDGLEALRGALWSTLRRVRIYPKEPGHKPDLARPFVLRAGATVHDLALHIHKDVAAHLKFARIWGDARFDGQQVDRHHVLADRDVVEIHA